MKVMKFIGKEINGFIVLDSYARTMQNGKTVRKVLLKCAKCGREFERCSSIDFDHIKCKCMTKSANIKPMNYTLVTYNGETLNASQFCKKYGLKDRTVRNYLKRGVPVEEIVKGEFTCTCKLCGKQFIGKRPSTTYCSKTCFNRMGHGKGAYKQKRMATCIVCGKEFETLRDDAATCSRNCRMWRDRVERNGRYNDLKAKGQFDHSVTLNNVYDKFNGQCAMCKRKLTFDCSCVADEYPSIDHIIPISKGGTHTWNNVQLLCRKCNYTKSDTLVDQIGA